jgi:hypothetical protein
VAAEAGRFESAEAVPEKNRDSGGKDRGEDDDEQQHGSVAGIEAKDHRGACEDFDHAYEGREEVGKWESDVGETPAAEISRLDEYEDSFGKKDQAHDHADEDHGEVFAHQASPAAAFNAKPGPRGDRVPAYVRTAKSIAQRDT